MRSRHFLIILLAAWLFCPAISHGQVHKVSGMVTDSVTGQPLAFVSIVVNGSRQGGLSDIDGYFSFTSVEKPSFLRISYLGYRTDTVTISGGYNDLRLRMSPVRYELSEVVILPGENPALRIVRRVIENSRKNDPEALSSFSCRSYNKITAEWLPNEAYFTALEKLNSDPKALDSGLIRLVNSTDKQHLMMLESYTRRIFRYPARSRETVLATRVSGFKNPDFAPLATDLQPFSFYGDMIDLNTGTVTGYQNPFGNGGIPRYVYLLEDTLYDGTDSIFVISFRPRPGRSFNGLQGIAYIHTDGYAIQNVIAEPAGSILWKIKVQQQYCRINDSVWFPEQLNYDWTLSKYPNEKVGVVMKGRSYIDSVEIDIPLRAGDFGPDKVELSKNAGRRDSLYWTQHRPDTLDNREQKTYAVMDSLGRKYNLDYYNRAAPAIMEGFLPIGPLDLSYEQLYNYNDYEGHRIGLGLRTGEKIAKWFHLGGYFAYGFRDDAMKYGGDLWFRLWKKQDLELEFSYLNDVVAPGGSGLYHNAYSSYWFDMIGKRFDITQSMKGSLRFRSLKYLETEVSFCYSQLTPAYDYRLLSGCLINDADSQFVFSEARIAMRYAVRDEITQAFGKRISTGSRFPVFYATFTRGIQGLWESEYPYNKLELAISQNFRIRNLGKTSLLAEAGKIWDPVPYSRTFRGRGSYGGDISFLLNNSFQTMRPDEFACDEYVSFYFRHNFGNFLFKAGKFKPEFIIAHNLMFGDMTTRLGHVHILSEPLKAPEKGFFEAGLIIDNLIRLKLLNIAYLGIGGGAFYRYGAYSFDKTMKNFAFKVSFRISG